MLGNNSILTIILPNCSIDNTRMADNDKNKHTNKIIILHRVFTLIVLLYHGARSVLLFSADHASRTIIMFYIIKKYTNLRIYDITVFYTILCISPDAHGNVFSFFFRLVSKIVIIL